jgi:hypothetical protein
MSADHKLAEAYITELCGGCGKLRLSARGRISYYVTHFEYVEACRKMHALWPNSFSSEKNQYRNVWTESFAASPDFLRTVEACIVTGKRPDGESYTSYHITLIDENPNA